MIDERKRELRKRYGQIRRSLSPAERVSADERIARRLVTLDAYADAPLVLTYLSFGSEIDTYRIIERMWADGKAVALPRCQTDTCTLEWYQVTSFDRLERSSLGMCEPSRDAGGLLVREDFAGSLAIVPGLSFDAVGNRLGYGGGYYDRFLSWYPGSSVGLCRECQMDGDLRASCVIEAHDCPVDIVVTERRTFVSSGRARMGEAHSGLAST